MQPPAPLAAAGAAPPAAPAPALASAQALAPTRPTPPALAHVYLIDAGVDLSQEELSHLAYDDATQQLIAVKGGHVFAYAADGGALKWMYPLQVCCVCVWGGVSDISIAYIFQCDTADGGALKWMHPLQVRARGVCVCVRLCVGMRGYIGIA